PYRLVKCLEQLSEHCGNDREAVVCRELTKFYEEVKRGSVEDLIIHFKKTEKVKGEIVIVVAGK
ncbi:MAG: 16S rRNA (cytidine(1402)-2'-O)-methyltransferase, partial [Saprospiraceae bacterium]